MENTMHTQPHPLAGKTVIVAAGAFTGLEYRLEDWWDHLTGKTWLQSASAGNPAALEYVGRAGVENVPPDYEVVYGKIGAYGKLIHVSQLGEAK
jgi:hypothetical protein